MSWVIGIYAVVALLTFGYFFNPEAPRSAATAELIGCLIISALWIVFIPLRLGALLAYKLEDRK